MLLTLCGALCGPAALNLPWPLTTWPAMRILLKILWNVVAFFMGVVVGAFGQAFVIPFAGDFGWDFDKYAHVTSYWLKTNRPGAAGERARCEEGPRIDLLQESARFQTWDRKLADCAGSGSPFEDRKPHCSFQSERRAEHLNKVEDAKKRLAACSPQPPPH